MKNVKGLLAKFGLVTFLTISSQSIHAGQVVLQPGPGIGKDIWTTNIYSYATGGGGPGGGLDNEWLRVGGWGDKYYSLIEFDLTYMPKAAQSAKLELFSPRRGTTRIHLDRIAQFWDWKTQGTGSDRERLWWADRPAATQWMSSSLPAPTAGQWYHIDITDLYNAWQNSTYPNYGVQLRPVSNNNQWSEFYSSDYLADPSLRPKLVLESSEIANRIVYQPSDSYSMYDESTNLFVAPYCEPIGDSSFSSCQVNGSMALIPSSNTTLGSVQIAIQQQNFDDTITVKVCTTPSCDAGNVIDSVSQFVPAQNYSTGTSANQPIFTFSKNAVLAKNVTYYIGVFPSSTPVYIYSPYNHSGVSTALFVVKAGVGVVPFLAFPLDCSTPDCFGGILYTRGAYTANSVVSVVDHSMRKNDNGTYPYGKVIYPSGVKGLDGIVLAWTGEKGQGTPISQGCYPQVYPQVGGTFIIGGTYASGGTDVNGKKCSLKRLNYDDHPGYDYKAAYGTPVKAAASGAVVNIAGEKCFKNNIGPTCADWGAVGIDHKNGYISQYLHMSSISVNSGDKISKGQVIGYSGYTGLPSVESSHLHFEILKKVGKKYFTVDPYGWFSGSCQSDPMYLWTGICNVRLWK